MPRTRQQRDFLHESPATNHKSQPLIAPFLIDSPAIRKRRKPPEISRYTFLIASASAARGVRQPIKKPTRNVLPRRPDLRVLVLLLGHREAAHGSLSVVSEPDAINSISGFQFPGSHHI